MKDLLQSKMFKAIILSICALIVLTFIFGMGVFIGTKRANFSFMWADEYHRNFGGPQGGFFGDFMGMDRQFPNANGSFGQIIKIDNGILTVKDLDNTEKIILVDNKTAIIYQRSNIKISDLKVDDNVIVIGDPNSSGQIVARLIRIMPPLPKNLPANSQQN